MERDRFLARVRAAAATTPGLPEVVAPFPGVPELPSVDPAAVFCERLRAVDAQAHPVAGVEEATAAVLETLHRHKANEVLSWDPEMIPIPGLFDRLADEGIARVAAEVPRDPAARIEHHLGLRNLVAGITGADAGLVESGSVVLRHGPGRPRLASLAPEVHVAVLRAEQLHRSLAHFLHAEPGSVGATANLQVITGPSRTADIEQRLNLGVHGPRHLHVVLLT